MNTNLLLDLDDPFVFHPCAAIRVHSCSFVADFLFLNAVAFSILGHCLNISIVTLIEN